MYTLIFLRIEFHNILEFQASSKRRFYGLLSLLADVESLAFLKHQLTSDCT